MKQCGGFTLKLSVLCTFFVSVLGLSIHEAGAATYNGPFFLQNGIGGAGTTETPSTNGNVRYQYRVTSFTGSEGAESTGWLKIEWNSWDHQVGANDGATYTLSPEDTALVSGANRLQLNNDCGGNDPDDISLGDVEGTEKTYILNYTDTGTELADSCLDDQVAFAVNEINHQGALVALSNAFLTTISGPNLILESGSTAEQALSNEELWFMWTTNDFTDVNYVEITDITNNTSLELTGISLGSTLKWNAMTSADTDSNTVAGISSGVNNFDAIAIEKGMLQSFIFLTGTQEIAVLGADMSEIANGETVTDKDVGTDFGTWNILNGSQSTTFTILNQGDGVLNLTGLPIVDLTGSADFTVTAQPSMASLSESNTTTFTVLFDPSVAGSQTAVVSIANNDSDEDPYTFEITGAGHAGVDYFVNDANVAGDVFVSAVGDDANDGLSPSTPKLRIQDVIDSYVLGPGDTVFIDTGVYSDEFRLDGTDFGSFEEPLTFEGTTNTVNGGSMLQFTGIAVIVDSAENIVLDTLKIAHSEQGVYANNSSLMLDDVIVFNNKEGVELDGSSIALIRNTVLASNETWQLTVHGTASSAVDNCTLWGLGGLYYDNGAAIMISNSFIGAETESAIMSPDGVEAPIGDRNIFWYPQGSQPFASLNGAPFNTLADFQQTFDVFWDSTVADPMFNAPEDCDFHVASSVGRFDPVTEMFAVDAMDSPLIDTGSQMSPFTDEMMPNGGRINIGAFGATEQASKSRATAWLLALTFPDGGNAQDSQDLAWVAANVATDDTVSVSYSVDNGMTWTNISTNTIAQEENLLWDTTTAPASTQAWWRVILNADTNVSDMNDGMFNLGFAQDPEISVSGGDTVLVEIVSGDITPEMADGTDFGVGTVANLSIDHTFVISNAGPGVLLLPDNPPVQLVGDADFSLQSQPASLIPAGGTESFIVRFHALEHGGPRTGMVSIASSDPDEDPYTFALSAVGEGTLYNGSLYLQSGVGHLGGTETPFTNGNIRYQWRKTEQNAAAGWLKWEWDSWATQVGGIYGGVTSAPNDNVEIIPGRFKGAFDTTLFDPSNIEMESLETNKTYVYNIADNGTILASSLSNGAVQIAIHEVNHAQPLVSLSNGVMTSLSGSNVVLDSGSTAENAGSNEELWFQWTTNAFADVNFVEVTDITNNTAIELTLDEGSDLLWLVISTADADINTITSRWEGLLGFDIASIEKSGVGSYTVTFGGDSDGDGMDDAWEMFYFGNLDKDGTEDSDGDGVNDVGEYLSGTNPNDAGDVFEVETADAQTTPGSVELKWTGNTGHVYKVYCDNVHPGTWTNLVFSGPGTGGEMAVTNALDASSDLTVYRLEAQKP